MNPPAPDTLVLAPDVVLVGAPDGTARLLDMDGQFHALSAVAAVMLRETLAGGEEAAGPAVAGRDGADPPVVAPGLSVFLRRLGQKGLLGAAGAGRPRRGR